jgi:hypothetical protein
MKPKFQRPLLIALVSLATSAQSRPQTNGQALKSEYEGVKATLKSNFAGFSITDNPLASGSLDREWNLLAQWIEQYLNERPSATTDEIKTAIVNLDSSLDVDALRLDEHAYVISTSQGELGNILIIALEAGRYTVTWNIKTPGQSALDKFPELVAWSSESASSKCYQLRNEKDWWRCGPLFGKAERLATDSKGRARFFIAATRAQEAGATVGAQLSIWEWDGKNVRPLLVRPYVYMLDQTEGVRLDGEFLRVREKKEFRTFFSCGSCEGRQMDWTIRVSDAGIEDLGTKSVVPELDLVDEVYFRIEHAVPADELASARVAATLKDSIQAVQREYGGKDEGKYPSLGMLGQWKLARDGKTTKLCFSTDFVGPYLFTVQSPGKTLFLADVHNLNIDSTRAGKDCSEAFTREK